MEIAIAFLWSNLMKCPFLFISLCSNSIPTIISSSCKIVLPGPRKKSFNLTSLFYLALSIFISASRESSGTAISAAGEAITKFPPIVAVFLSQGVSKFLCSLSQYLVFP